MIIDRDQIVDAVRLDEPNRPGIRGIIQRQKKQILVNMIAFFLLSSVYSFEVFVVNFLGKTTLFNTLAVVDNVYKIMKNKAYLYPSLSPSKMFMKKKL